jgi:hypothetical protein
MRKIVIALLFSGSALFASPNSSTLQGEDAQFLFGNQKANVELISQNEMIETEGKYYPIYMGLRYGIALGYQAYRAYGVFSRSSRISYPLTFGWTVTDAW